MVEERFTRDGYKIWDNVKNEEFYELHYRYECEDMCDELNKYEDKVVELIKENEQLKKEYYQMRNLYFKNAEDICNNCKHTYLVEVKDMQGYYHQKCKKGYSECPKGTVTYCGDFELKGDVDD